MDIVDYILIDIIYLITFSRFNKPNYRTGSPK
jgi:hypothetical protein